VSWAPLADRPQNLAPHFLKGLPVVGEWVKGGILRAALLSGIFDSLKQHIFFLPVKWHAGPLSQAWERREVECQTILRRYLWDIESLSEGHLPEKDDQGEPIWSHNLKRGVGRILLIPLVTLGRVWMIGSNLFHARDRLKTRLHEAWRGDENARTRIVQRFGTIWKIIRGVPMRHF